MSSHVMKAIKGQPWNITHDGLDLIVGVASREMQAISARRSEPMSKRAPRAYIRDGIAVLQVYGPIFKGGHKFEDVSAATSYRSIMADFADAIANPEVHSILLDIDSPGGQAAGNSELSEYIYSHRATKAIYAYTGGAACSAAYWLASATSRIFASDSAVLGSIGCICYADGKKDPDEVKFVSAVSPNKAADIDTEVGKAELQAKIDRFGELFVSAVAKNRGISTDQVIEGFGEGKTYLGEEASAVGLCDEITTFEETIKHIQKENALKLTTEKLRTDHPDLVSEIRDEAKEEFEASVQDNIDKAKADERERIMGLLALTKHRNSQEVVMAAIEDSEATSATVALKILEAQAAAPTSEPQDQGAGFLRGLKSTEASQDAPGLMDDEDTDSDEEKIRAAVRKIHEEK